MSVAVTSVEKINSLKTGIEATTGESYNDLTEAVQDLKNGYGQSGGGEIGKPYIDTSKITDFSYFCYGNKLNDYLDGLDTSKGTNFRYMFQSCGILTAIPQLDTSNGTNFYYMFDGCAKLTAIPQLDTSNGINLDYVFYNCLVLTAIPQLDISNGKTFQNTFGYCVSLETLSLTTAKTDFKTNTFQSCRALKNLTIGEGWAVNIYLTYSPNLTVESLHGMIENLADLTGATAKTFSVGETNLAKIDEEHIAMLMAKNWNYS